MLSPRSSGSAIGKTSGSSLRRDRAGAARIRTTRSCTAAFEARLSHKSPSDPVCRTVMGRPMFKAPKHCNQMGRDRRQRRESDTSPTAQVPKLFGPIYATASRQKQQRESIRNSLSQRTNLSSRRHGRTAERRCSVLQAAVFTGAGLAPAPDELQASPGPRSAPACLLQRRCSSAPGAIEFHARRQRQPRFCSSSEGAMGRGSSRPLETAGFVD
jgi:hypothetical protein